MRIQFPSSLLRLLLIAFLLTSPALALQRGPSTAEERTRAVQIVRSLEANPLNKPTIKDREWLLMWIIEIPDISVTICTDPIKPILGKKKNYSSDLVTQYMVGMVAYLIENPDKDPKKTRDQFPVQLAGIESMLKAYESILKVKPKAKWPELDNWIELRNAGTLADEVRKSMPTGCT